MKMIKGPCVNNALTRDYIFNGELNTINVLTVLPPTDCSAGK